MYTPTGGADGRARARAAAAGTSRDWHEVGVGAAVLHHGPGHQCRMPPPRVVKESVKEPRGGARLDSSSDLEVGRRPEFEVAARVAAFRA